MQALLALYQALRIAITDAVATVPGTDPDRASYQVAAETAADLVTSASNIISGTPDLVGGIGRAVPARLPCPLPSCRRLRPRRPGEPARPAPAPGLRPQGQVAAKPLEQAPARQAPQEPAGNQDHHHHQPGSPAETRDTPPTVLDARTRALTPWHWA